jgi:hypothetical protein
MHGEAAASPRSGATRASENTASVSLRGPRGHEEQRGAFPWGAHQRDRQTQRDFGLAAVVCRVRNSVPRFVARRRHRKAEEEAASSANGDDENAARRRLGAEIESEFLTRDTR